MKYIHYIAIITLMLVGCQQKRAYFPKDCTPAQVTIVRFDEAIMNVREESVLDDVRYLYTEYEEFMPVFVEDILGINADDTAYLCEALPQFLEDTTYGFRDTNLRVKEVFSNVDDIETALANAFGRIQYLYPDWEIPTIYFFISGFNASIFFMDDAIAVGTDMYLGSNYEYYNRVVHNYQKLTMRRECIVADVVSAYLFRNIAYTSHQNRLLDNMIYRGKVMYLLSCILDQEKEYDVMGYTKEQWNWCITNERNIWNLMMDRRDLFNSKSMTMTGYLNDGPFCSEISQDCPARIGTWMGWRIVESYMQHNETVSMQELMNNGDAQMILENSFYKP